MPHELLRLVPTLFAFLLTAVTLSLPAVGQSAGGPGKPRLDAYGDPLPAGATARFGSVRWRTPEAVKAVAVSPDGTRAASVDRTGTVIIWDMATGRHLHNLADSEAGEGCLAFSPDGRTLATGGGRDPLNTPVGNFRVRVWEVHSGKEVAHLPVQRGPIEAVAFTPDGTALVSGGLQQPVIVWAFPGENKVREFPTRSTGGQPFALSPNGRWLAVRERSEEISLYTFDRGVKVHTLRTDMHIEGFRFSADSRSLLTEGASRLHFWEVATGKQRLLPAVVKGSGWSAYPAPGGRKVAIVGIGSGIRWLDALTGEVAGSWPEPRDGLYLTALTFSPDGRAVVTGGLGTVRVWDAISGKALREPSSPSPYCGSLVFAPDGKTLVASGFDLRFLDGQTLRERCCVQVNIICDVFGRSSWSNRVAVSPDGTLTAAVGIYDEILMVDPRLRKVVRTLRHPGWRARDVAFGPDGKKLYAVTGRDEAVRVWDIATGKVEPALCTDLAWASNLAIAPAGGKLAVATGGPEPRCRLWDLRTGKELPSLEDAPDNILFSQDGNRLACYHLNGRLTVWDLAKRAALRRFDFKQKKVTACTFSADGRLLITGHPDRSFRTWDLADGKKVAEVRGHPGGIVALVCSPDGEGLVSACTGCTVLRWKAAAWKGK
jgi:WD40 repeat protein